MADKKKSSSSSKESSSKSSSSSSKKEKELSMEELETKLRGLNEDVIKVETNLRDIEHQINKIIYRAYSSLHGVEGADDEESKMEPKALREAFTKNLENEKVFTDKYLSLLSEQQGVVQKLRLAVCKDAAEKQAKKESYKIGSHTSQLLSQTTLSSADDLNVDWSKLGSTSFSPSELGSGWDSDDNKIADSPFASVYQVKYKSHPICAKKLKDKVPADEVAYLKANFGKIAAIRATPLISYIAISDDGKVILTEKAGTGPLNKKVEKKYITEKLDFIRKTKIMRAFTEAINFLHSQDPPVIHGRIKPSNVLLTTDNKLKIAEFGRVFKLDKAQIEEGGYVPYMAPELFDGKERSAATDLYAYGMVLYFLFMNKDPYEKKTYDQVKAESHSASNDVVVSLDKSDLPRSLVQFIKTCIDPEPSKRPIFSNILTSKPFTPILTEHFDQTRGEARNIWRPENSMKLPWKEFVPNWSKKFSPLTERQEKTLRILMNVPYSENLDTTSVERAKFDSFLTWFGPLNAKTYSAFWTFVNQLMCEEWFHAEVSDHQAREKLRSGKVNNNNYLVRCNTYSKTEERDEPFVISYRMDVKGKTRTFEAGFRIRYDSNQKPADYVAAAFKDKGVTQTLAGCNYDRSNSFKDLQNHSDSKPSNLSAAAKHTGAAAGGYVIDTELLEAVNVTDD